MLRPPCTSSDSWQPRLFYGCGLTGNIGKYVDGDNDKAEFYIFTYDPSATSFQWWD